MLEIVSLLFLLTFLALIIGIIKPSLVKQNSRGQVFKKFGVGTIVLIFLVGIIPANSSVAELVKSAREEVSNDNYGMAVNDYKKALEKWDQKENYSFTKQELKKELANVRSDELLTEALDEIEDDNYEDALNNITKAKKLVDNKRVKELKSKLKSNTQKLVSKHIEGRKDKIKELNNEINKLKEEINSYLQLNAYLVQQIEEGTYEIIEPESNNHALLKTVETKFNTKGTFTMYVKKLPNKQEINTVDGFNQKWTVYKENKNAEENINEIKKDIEKKKDEKQMLEEEIIKLRDHKSKVDISNTTIEEYINIINTIRRF